MISSLQANMLGRFCLLGESRELCMYSGNLCTMYSVYGYDDIYNVNTANSNSCQQCGLL